MEIAIHIFFALITVLQTVLRYMFLFVVAFVNP
jgi:hypothetical protein